MKPFAIKFFLIFQSLLTTHKSFAYFFTTGSIVGLLGFVTASPASPHTFVSAPGFISLISVFFIHEIV